MNVEYRWMMLIGRSTYEVHPIYKDDLSLNYERETGQQFFRAKLSSKITFVAADAQHIISAPFYTDFKITIQKSIDQRLTWSDYYQCHFFKTDCTINEDDKSVSVQPTVKDRYEAVLNGMEKEFNLIELAPAIEPIKAKKRPMLQIYAAGDSVVSNLFGGNYFESDKNGDGDPLDYGFHRFDTNMEFDFTNNSQVGFTTPFTGAFDKYSSTTFRNVDNVYYLYYYWDNPGGGVFINGIDVRRVSDNVTLWNFEQEEAFEVADLPTTITFTPSVEGLSAITANRFGINVYGRYVTDVPSFVYNGQTIECSPIESGDIVGNNRNYGYMTGYGAIGITHSLRYSNEPTEWGKNDYGQYFLPPDDEEEWHPIGQSQWVNASLWMRYDAAMRAFEQEASKQYVIKDTYPLWSVISVLLKKIAPNITHAGTSQYSKFFYDNTATGLAGQLNGTLTFLSQKSNVLAGEHQEPAQKAMVTLKSVFEMLKKAFGCYWYIDSNNKLIIEHLQYFKNGGSYSGTPAIGYDLTALENLPNGKKWAFCTSEYQFDKEDMPARYQYEWMDKSTELFNGSPINVVSRFVKENKVEEVTVANFTSDIDYMLLAGENCSKDGFALLQAQLINGWYELPYHTYIKFPYQYSLQNYIVSMENLQQKFLTYDMPSWNIEIDGTNVTAAGIQRNKKQTLSFPAGESDPDTEKLVKTNMGNGQYDKIAVNLSSRTAKVTLKYNTYDN